jgi:AhpC/TSA family
MLRCAMGSAVLLLPAALSFAAQDTAVHKSPPDKPKAAKPATPAEQYRALVKEYEMAMKEQRTTVGAAKTPDERTRARRELDSQRGKYAEKFLTFADSHIGESAAVDALLWLIQNCDGPDRDKGIQRLQWSGQASDPAAIKALQSLAQKSADAGVAAKAAYSLAFWTKGKVDRAEANAGRYRKEAESYYELAISKSEKAGNQPLMNRARGELFELRHLFIGHGAPEITGEDIDGKKFKLSDYRGKVVMLDFWGHW